jgi:hypothetical protein|tara:strand:- start:156 stop:1226 length:1071 start_codon:yes stop_codon:yes gene_type:complete
MSKAAELANLIGNINAGGGGVNRNLIINGAMNVAQRSTSVADLGDTNKTAAYLTLDRMYMNTGNTTGRMTMSQDSSAPEGFANSLKLDCTTADTSIASNEAVFLQTNFEGQNLQVLKKGTSSAVPVTVSFYVKGNASATYVCELYDYDNTRQISQTFNVTTDWTRVELTFVGDTSGTLDDDNGLSFAVNIWLHAGANFNPTSGGTLSTSWTSVTSASRAVGISSILDSTDRTFFITGWQMEVGQNSTEFEHEPFDTTFRKCQRYYETKNDTADSSYVLIGYQSDGSNFRQAWEFQVTKRADPALSLATGASWESASGYSAPTEYSGATHVEYYNTENFYCKQSTNNAPNLVADSEL